MRRRNGREGVSLGAIVLYWLGSGEIEYLNLVVGIEESFHRSELQL